VGFTKFPHTAGARPNASDRFRVAQFVRGTRAGEMAPARAAARAVALRRELDHAGLLGELTPLAPHVFAVAREGRGLEGGAVAARGELQEVSDMERVAQLPHVNSSGGKRPRR
jgi:hypothetical protein